MRQRGYTFVEILVVVTIIAVIAGISAVSYSGITKSSRDARRMSDIEMIRSALELYRSETGYYPDLSADSQGCLDVAEIADTSVTPSVSYLNLVPKDPKHPDMCYTYSKLTQVTYNLTYYSEKDEATKTVTNP